MIVSQKGDTALPKRKTGQPKLLTVRPVEISWVDATGHSGWQTVSEAMAKRPVLMYTLGYLIDRNKKYIKLVRSLDNDGEDVGDVFTIPTDWVQRVRRLKKR
jgi:hypothetical protein